MDLSEKIIDKKEELLDEFENLSLDEIAKKIKGIEKRDDDVIFKNCISSCKDFSFKSKNPSPNK